jgi:16S rRNA (guanine(966)-N(2))-methyltransferase RsmD
LFNVLGARVDFAGLAVLDLYAGSGALGLEALSRGATSAVFVESDRRAAAVIADNVRSLGAGGAVVRCGTVASVLAAGGDGPADLVFADPPYEVSSTEVDAVLSTLFDGGWVSTGTIAAIERPTSSPTLTWPAGWAAWRARRYGDTRIEFGEIA